MLPPQINAERTILEVARNVWMDDPACTFSALSKYSIIMSPCVYFNGRGNTAATLLLPGETLLKSSTQPSNKITLKRAKWARFVRVVNAKGGHYYNSRLVACYDKIASYPNCMLGYGGKRHSPFESPVQAACFPLPRQPVSKVISGFGHIILFSFLNGEDLVE